MTRDELTNLSADQWIALALQSQETIQELQMRISQLEGHTTSASAPGQTSAAPTASAVAFSDRKRARRHRHRPWYRKVWRAFFPGNLSVRRYLVIVLVVLLLAVLLGLFVAQNSSRGGSSEPAPAGYVVSWIVV